MSGPGWPHWREKSPAPGAFRGILQDFHVSGCLKGANSQDDCEVSEYPLPVSRPECSRRVCLIAVLVQRTLEQGQGGSSGPRSYGISATNQLSSTTARHRNPTHRLPSIAEPLA